MSRIVRLGQLFELKYSWKAEAAIRRTSLPRVKDDLVNAYKLYVAGDTAKDPVLQILANAGDVFSKNVVDAFIDLVSQIDNSSAEDLFHRLGPILGAIREAKKTGSVREFIHNNVRVNKESDRNYREYLKSKFEMIISRLSSILEKASKELQEESSIAGPLEGGMVDPQRKELSKEKLLIFMRTPAAQNYGLDNIDVLSEALQDPQLKQRITTLINAIDRGQIPVDGPAVHAEAAAIRKWLDDRQKTNLPALEHMPENPASPMEEEGTEE